MTNIAILTGRIARDPETRETKGGTNVTGITVCLLYTSDAADE